MNPRSKKLRRSYASRGFSAKGSTSSPRIWGRTAKVHVNCRWRPGAIERHLGPSDRRRRPLADRRPQHRVANHREPPDRDGCRMARWTALSEPGRRVPGTVEPHRDPRCHRGRRIRIDDRVWIGRLFGLVPDRFDWSAGCVCRPHGPRLPTALASRGSPRTSVVVRHARLVGPSRRRGRDRRGESTDSKLTAQPSGFEPGCLTVQTRASPNSSAVRSRKRRLA